MVSELTCFIRFFIFSCFCASSPFAEVGVFFPPLRSVVEERTLLRLSGLGFDEFGPVSFDEFRPDWSCCSPSAKETAPPGGAPSPSVLLSPSVLVRLASEPAPCGKNSDAPKSSSMNDIIDFEGGWPASIVVPFSSMVQSGASSSASSSLRGVRASSSTSPARTGRNGLEAGAIWDASSMVQDAVKPSSCQRRNSVRENIMRSMCCRLQTIASLCAAFRTRTGTFCSSSTSFNSSSTEVIGGSHDMKVL
mmetsp:Transcript_34092/g.101291  ORF Transcript_34092/g.101291 Transcript_34092/m.101291 type:complete len:249 (-) Transcript_34092:466-1212(-)